MRIYEHSSPVFWLVFPETPGDIWALEVPQTADWDEVQWKSWENQNNAVICYGNYSPEAGPP